MITYVRSLLETLTTRQGLLFLGVLVCVLFFSLTAPAFAEENSGIGQWIFQAFLDGVGKFIAFVLLFISSILALTLGTVSYLFNTAMLLTVFRFADYFGNSDGLLLAWTILRDIANIVLLFGFIFMGIATILDVDLHKYNAKRTLPTLIIFAILLNFSLFTAEAIVDVANSVSASFYTQAAGGVDCSTDEGIQICAEDGLAGKIVQATGLAGVLNIGDLSGYENIWTADDGLQAAVVFFMLFMLVVTTIIVLLFSTVLLVSRAIVLAIVFVTSPIGFAGMAIPPLQGLSKQWWDALINNALFAPAFVLLVLVGLKILEGLYTALGVTTDDNLLRVLLSDDPQAGVLTGNVFVMFAFAIGFFIAALLVAQHLGVVGAQAVVGKGKDLISRSALFGGRVAGFAGFGVPAWAARQTAGRAASWTGRALRRSGFVTVPVVGKPITQGFESVAGSSMDIRGTGITGKAFGQTGDISKATKKGYTGVAEHVGGDKSERAESVAKARKDWLQERENRSNAMATRIGKAKTVSEREALEKKKERYDRRTQRAFRKFESKDEKDKFKDSQDQYFDLKRQISDAIRAGNQPLVDQLKNDIKPHEEAVGNKGQTDAFLRDYANSMAEMADVLRYIGYDIRGMRITSSKLNKSLGKTSNDILIDQLKGALKP